MQPDILQIIFNEGQRVSGIVGWNKVRVYLRKGFVVRNIENGIYDLEKEPSIQIKLSYEYYGEERRRTENFSNKVLRHYKVKELTPEVAEKFKKDVESGKIKIHVDIQDRCYIE